MRNLFLFCFLSCVYFAGSTLAATQAPKTSILQYVVVSEMPEELPRWARPKFHRSQGFELSIAVEGRGIIEVRKEDVTIRKFTSRDGKDLLKGNGDGKLRLYPSVEIDSFDRDCAVISLSSLDDFIGKVDGAVLEGSLKIRYGTEKELKKSVHRLKVGGIRSRWMDFLFKQGMAWLRVVLMKHQIPNSSPLL
jgi:hypothetical protein